MVKEFQGKYRFLSNFTPNGKGFSVEKYYQFYKALLAGDPNPQMILRAQSGAEARRMGKKFPRPANAVQIMEDLVRFKFKEDPILLGLLLQTGDAELVEGNNWHDTFWGICNGRCKKQCTFSGCLHEPEGENQLGKILMKVREELRDGGEKGN